LQEEEFYANTETGKMLLKKIGKQATMPTTKAVSKKFLGAVEMGRTLALARENKGPCQRGKPEMRAKKLYANSATPDHYEEAQCRTKTVRVSFRKGPWLRGTFSTQKKWMRLRQVEAMIMLESGVKVRRRKGRAGKQQTKLQ